MTATPAVVVFGGSDNALSIARSLGRRSVAVYPLACSPEVSHSRFARRLAFAAGGDTDAALRFLLGPESDFLRGALVLAGSDDALECIADHRDELGSRFLLDLSDPVAQRKMLDKLETYEAARELGVPTPKFWKLESKEALAGCRDDLVYPLIVKPRLSHLFQKRFGGKFLEAASFDQVREAFDAIAAERIDVLLVEKIPGPDSRLCSYYTYLDERGEPQFDFTKRIVRRHPVNMGLATFHVTDRVPEVREHALRLFQGVGLRGLANAEFKLDERDGGLKLIECNARFTAANGLVLAAGLDLAALVYNRAAGLPPPKLDRFRSGLHLWDPVRDFKAFRELRERRELTAFGWLRSVLRPLVFPAFAWSDPAPALARLRRRLFKGIG